MMVDPIVCCFPLLGEDHVVFLNGILDHVGCCQYLLTMLFGIHLNTMNLCHVGSPLHLGVVHLRNEC